MGNRNMVYIGLPPLQPQPKLGAHLVVRDLSSTHPRPVKVGMLNQMPCVERVMCSLHVNSPCNNSLRGP